MSEREEVEECSCFSCENVETVLDALRQRVRELEAAVMGVNEELERERLRLAACGVAARGESRSVNTIYTSDSLKAVVALRTRAERAERERERMREVVEAARAQLAKAEEWLSCNCPPDCHHDFEYDRATTRTESAVRALDAHHASEGEG